MLRLRLFLNMVAFVVLLVAVGVYAIVLLSRLAGQVNATVTGNYRSILIAQSMRLELKSMEQEIWIFSRGTNDASSVFMTNKVDFEKNLTALTEKAWLPEEGEFHRKLTTNYAAFAKSVATITAADASQLRRTEYQLRIVPGFMAMNSALQKIHDLNNEAILATPQGIQMIRTDVTRLMIIGLLVSLAISVFFGFQLSRAILAPIQSLTQATRDLGEGKWDRPVAVASGDELGELALSFNKMAAQLQAYRAGTTEQIGRLHRTMETTLASFPDPIFVLNRTGQIELKNPAAEQMSAGLGLQGKLPEQLEEIAGSALAQDKDFLPQSFAEVVCYRFDATEKYYLPRVLVMHSKDAALFGVAVVLYDVTRFRLLDAAKSNLVATVSHELKTPLTGLRLALHLLTEQNFGKLQPRQEELISGAREDAERLLRILNDLLDLARLDEGIAELRKERVSPARLLKGVVGEFAALAASRGLTITCDVEPKLPAISVDRQRIGHAFTNLVSNAIKHSPEGGKIILRASRNDENWVRFSVNDQGPGIAEEFQARVFDRFFRVPGQDKTGAGLGLSIAREIIVAHGGRVGLKSLPGEGCTFSMVLPPAANNHSPV